MQDIIRKSERKNWFYSYNMIFEHAISEHAKITYLYLCRCADAEGQSFPSHSTIGKKCGIKSRQTVINALGELECIGLLSKEKRVRTDGGQTSNIYIIYDTPITPVQQMDTPCLGDGHEGLSFKGLSNLKDYPVNSQGQTEQLTIDMTMTINTSTAVETKKEEPSNHSADQSNGLKSSLQNSQFEDDYITYKEIIQGNIEYSYFLQNRNTNINMIDELINCMLDVICTKGDTVKINGEEKNRNMVKSIYLKINSMDIEHVLDRYKDQYHKITHHHNYLKTMLYTVKQEGSHFYTNLVNKDMAEGTLY